MLKEGEYRFTKQMVADFYDVDVSTIDRYLSIYAEELKYNGYILSKGKQLKEFKLQFAHLINEASKTTQIGLFNFRAFLNIGMLLTNSEKAKQVRSLMLDIVISCINDKVGGGTKSIVVMLIICQLLLRKKIIVKFSLRPLVCVWGDIQIISILKLRILFTRPFSVKMQKNIVKY